MRRISRSLMRRVTGVGIVLVAATALVALTEPPRALAGSCGEPGMPACPLQSYMRGRIAGPLSRNDMATVATSLDGVSAMQPDPSWSTCPPSKSYRAARPASKGPMSPSPTAREVKSRRRTRS